MTWFVCFLLLGFSSGNLEGDPRGKFSFHKPIKLSAGADAIRVEGPGYASPCWGDVNGDGLPDLLVGQFRGGRIHLFKNQGEGRLAPGTFLQAGGKTAEVPGVW